MLLGVVGKPSSGKTTFFNACTELSAKTAEYPFTTIEPNIGVTYVRVECPHVELGKKCSPNSGFCVEGQRFVPVDIIDVAGLVPGAHEGRGLGNKFLDDLRRADVLIHVVDASGRTDAEGNPCEFYDPVEEVLFLRAEIKAWIERIVEKAYEKARKKPQWEKEFYSSFTGLGISPEVGREIYEKAGEDVDKWAEEILAKKPIVIAANKIDLEGAEENYKRLKKEFGKVFPVSAVSEYVLRKAASGGFIKYVPGDGDFEVLGSLTPEQEKGLEYIRERVLKKYGSTGVQDVINYAVFEEKKMKVVFPVEDENKWTDSKGKILPDALLLEEKAAALDLAYKIHTDIGKGFLYAIDARKKIRIGKEHVLKHGDVVKIVSAL